MSLQNARILVTGGSLGIGKETARMLIDKGAKVLITGRDEARLAAAAGAIGAQYLVADVARSEDIESTRAAVAEKLGGLDVLINNAGIGVFPTLEELTLEDFHTVFAVNVFGAAMMAQALVPMLKANATGGAIINIGSTAALKGFARGSVYAASKFALRALTESWQAELRKSNIRVMQINPSEVATAFAAQDRREREAAPNKLSSAEIAHAICAVLEMDKRGFIPELSVWATNPW